MNDYWLQGPDGLCLNPARRECVVNDRPLELDRITFDLLEALLRREGTFTSPAELVRAVWGYHEDQDFQFVYRAVARLRRLLAEAGVTNAIDSAGFVLKRSQHQAELATSRKTAAVLVENALADCDESVIEPAPATRPRPWFARINLETSTTSIIAIDADRHIVWANPAAEAFTGYTLPELIGLPTSEALSPPDRRGASQLAWDAVRQGNPLRGDTLIQTRDHGPVPALASWHSLNIDGQFFAFIELWPVNDGSALTRVSETASVN